MNFDILASLKVAGAAFQLGITFSDAETLYSLYSNVKSTGKLDLPGMAKTGALEADVASIARVSGVLNKLLADPVQGPRVKALIAAMPS